MSFNISHPPLVATRPPTRFDIQLVLRIIFHPVRIPSLSDPGLSSAEGAILLQLETTTRHSSPSFPPYRRPRDITVHFRSGSKCHHWDVLNAGIHSSPRPRVISGRNKRGGRRRSYRMDTCHGATSVCSSPGVNESSILSAFPPSSRTFLRFS